MEIYYPPIFYPFSQSAVYMLPVRSNACSLTLQLCLRKSWWKVYLIFRKIAVCLTKKHPEHEVHKSYAGKTFHKYYSEAVVETHQPEEVFQKHYKGESVQKRFEHLVEMNGALISRICFSYATDKEDFQDLRQDVLINIWKGLENFRGEASSVTWIYRVALNTCVSTVRKRSRRPSFESLDSLSVEIAEERNDDSLRERLEYLHRLIGELSPVDKALVTMWLDDVSYEEIAEVVGMSRNNIGIRLHRIRERWRKQAEVMQ